MKLRHIALIGSLFPFLLAIVLFFGVRNGHEPVRRGVETSAYGGEIR